MGRLEKITVLTVVFLAAVILAYSLNYGDDAEGPVADGTASSDLELAGGPGDDGASPWGAELASSAPEQEPPSVRAPAPRVSRLPEPLPEGELRAEPETSSEPRIVVAAAPRATGAGEPDAPIPSRGVLNSTVRSEGAQAEPAPPAGPAGSILKTLSGLEPSPAEDFYLYTWREGDTFTSVARELYGDLSLVRLLRTSNEEFGEHDLRPGDRILVPAFDGAQRDASGGTTYTVVEGDTLSSIARKVYGDASKYERLFEANRDVLANADTVASGQVLRIPR